MRNIVNKLFLIILEKLWHCFKEETLVECEPTGIDLRIGLWVHPGWLGSYLWPRAAVEFPWLQTLPLMQWSYNILWLLTVLVLGIFSITKLVGAVKDVNFPAGLHERDLGWWPWLIIWVMAFFWPNTSSFDGHMEDDLEYLCSATIPRKKCVFDSSHQPLDGSMGRISIYAYSYL